MLHEPRMPSARGDAARVLASSATPFLLLTHLSPLTTVAVLALFACFVALHALARHAAAAGA